MNLENTVQTVSLAHMPVEIKTFIAQYLPRTDLDHLGLISKEWRSIFLRETKKSIYIDCTHKDFNFKNMIDIFQCGLLIRIKLREKGDTNEGILTKLLETCLEQKIQMPSLEELEFDCDQFQSKLSARNEVLLSIVFPNLISATYGNERNAEPYYESYRFDCRDTKDKRWVLNGDRLAVFSKYPSLLQLLPVEKVKKLLIQTQDFPKIESSTLAHFITQLPELKLIDYPSDLKKPSDAFLGIIKARKIACFKDCSDIFYSWSEPNEYVKKLSITSTLLKDLTVQEIIEKFPNLKRITVREDILEKDIIILIKGLKHLREVYGYRSVYGSIVVDRYKEGFLDGVQEMFPHIKIRIF